MTPLDDGSPAPLGATWDGKGVNFALFSAHASAVELCLFDSSGRRQTESYHLPQCSGEVWHGHVNGLRPGQLYGYRVHGPYEPAHGHRFNPRKLLIDPYARRLFGRIRWHDAVYGYRREAHRADLTRDSRDSAPMMPKCIVEDPSHMWGGDRPPRHASRDSLIYEAHVKGLTQLHPDVPMAMRGTYAGLAHPAVVDHLVKLGVTAIELMPIHAFADDQFLVEKGLRNYWGYSTLAFFAPEPRYYASEGDGVLDLKAAIRTLHEAKIEVILDVVYNHTAEGNHLGPTLSFRGIDNRSYYKLSPDNPRFVWDVTGTGNTLDLAHPRVLQMVMDSLRHWVEAYHVDGFRFDLAPALARDPFDFTDRAGFLRAVGQDPVLSQVKLIAEPWDLGHDGYRLGQFPPGWSEWNDSFRDTIRAFWRGDSGQIAGLARALTGSREIFQKRARQPWASVQYACSHDGFTLQDLVSYDERHNEANGEDNKDGHPHNVSWNCGHEGPTKDTAILALRARQKRNFLATVFFSVGVPMLLMGDELSRTQNGNNNAYCQDNETSWLDWQRGERVDPDLLPFIQLLVRLRRGHDVFRRRRYLTGARVPKNGLKDVYWLAPEGREMTNEDWGENDRRTLGMQIGNDSADGQRFLVVLNAADEDVAFKLDSLLPGPSWTQVFDTQEARGQVRTPASLLYPGGTFATVARSLALFQLTSS